MCNKTCFILNSLGGYRDKRKGKYIICDSNFVYGSTTEYIDSKTRADT